MYIVVYSCIVLDLPRGRMVTPCVIEVFTHSSPTVIRDWDDALGAIRSGFTPLQLSRGCLNVPDVFLPHLPISFVAVFTRHRGEDVPPCRHPTMSSHVAQIHPWSRPTYIACEICAHLPYVRECKSTALQGPER